MLTIIFSTRNGERTLPLMLDSLLRVEVPQGGWKIVAVDNGSTDKTRNVIESYRNQLPIEYTFEPIAGKNHALNRGLSLIEGDLVIFTDDDIIADTQWLVALRRSVDTKPDYVGFGGSIIPFWSQPPPDWIFKQVRLGPVFAITDPNMISGEISPAAVWGPNMAIRAKIFQAGYCFDSTIGPDSTNSYRMGSETEFLLGLAKAGEKFWFCQDALVKHIIRPHQLAPHWIIQRGFRLGRQIYHRDLARSFNDNTMLFNVPRWRIRKFFGDAAKLALANLVFDSELQFRHRWEVAVFKGYFFEARQNNRLET